MFIKNNKDFIEVSEILKKISSQYPSDSKEYSVLEMCAKAIWFIYSNNKQDAFLEYIESGKIRLNEKQKKMLHDIGYFSQD